MGINDVSNKRKLSAMVHKKDIVGKSSFFNIHSRSRSIVGVGQSNRDYRISEIEESKYSDNTKKKDGLPSISNGASN